ncbi:hypothetical protein WR25_20870 [Diploscapter pachys]|uniref:Rhodanese domain-containing protein n=1 Tax=Diploscapter pachys TaxID=2018661 RepID=A0A2A2JPZ2_9BILA|nr:hypothetical protein WR25_20870 [Diploscapter pachys]
MSLQTWLVSLLLLICVILCWSVSAQAFAPYPYDSYYSGARFRRGPLMGFDGEDTQLQQLMQNLKPRPTLLIRIASSLGCIAHIHMATAGEIVEVNWLAGHINDPHVKVLDATYEVKPKPNWEEFKNTSYGKFDELIKTHANPNYTAEHIPNAVHFNLDVAYFPGQYERFSFYSPELFEQYVQKLGINKDDKLIVYSRGPAAGMLFAARVWWTFRVYGHHNIEVLNGGFNAWKSAGHPTKSGDKNVTQGNWKAGPIDKSLYANFDDLTNDPRGGNLFENKMSAINMLDARPGGQFNGSEPLGFPAPKATGSHVAGAKNVPLPNVVGETGVKDKSALEEALKKAGFDASKPTVTMCNSGVQASMLALGLARLGIKARVYNGSMSELALRASEYINSK